MTVPARRIMNGPKRCTMNTLILISGFVLWKRAQTLSKTEKCTIYAVQIAAKRSGVFFIPPENHIQHIAQSCIQLFYLHLCVLFDNIKLEHKQYVQGVRNPFDNSRTA